MKIVRLPTELSVKLNEIDVQIKQITTLEYLSYPQIVASDSTWKTLYYKNGFKL